MTASHEPVPAPGGPAPADPRCGLVPRPVLLSVDTGPPFVCPAEATVSCDPRLRPAVRRLCRELETAFPVDLTLAADPAKPAPGASVVVDVDASLPAGGYRLEVTHDGVSVECADLAGAHAATQTLRQLAGPQALRSASDGRPLVLAPVRVEDHPRFSWRGVLLDVARHFVPKDVVLRFVDVAAQHKLNVVHLHLTDDQGWRPEIRRYPELTRAGAWRAESTVGTWRVGRPDGRPHGGRYPQDDLREIVAFARDRGITVVPEIDVPGHVQAAIAAYPELGVTKQPTSVRTTWGVSTEVLDPSPETLGFFRGVLDEVMDVFDSPWVCLGGDEVPTGSWRATPAIVERAARLGLADVGELHGWFVSELCRHVLEHGRRPVVWDEALGPRLPTGTVVIAWRGPGHGARAVREGYDVVMAPEQVVYLDHRASDRDDEPVPVGFVRTVEDVYGFDPWPAAIEGGGRPAEPAGTLLGAQAQIWTEHLDTPRRLDYATHPRLAAFAEVAWSPAEERDPGSAALDDFLRRLREAHVPRLEAAGVEPRPLDGPHPWQTRPGVEGFPRDLGAEVAAGGWDGVGGWHEPPGGP